MVVLAAPLRVRLALHAAVAVCGLSSVSRTSLAAARRAARFEVTRSEEAGGCPDAPGLEAAVARIAGPPSLDTRAPVVFDVTFTRNEVAYVATLHAGATGAERVLVSRGPTCSALGEAVAAAITVVLDGTEGDEDQTSAGDAVAPVAPPPPLHVRVPPPPPVVVHGAPVADEFADPPPRTAMNIVFAEFLGSGVAYTINYERFFDDDASVRVGFGYLRENEELGEFSPATQRFVYPKKTQLSLPILANYYYLGHPNHNIHFAAGATLRYRTGELEDGWTNPANVGYPSDASQSPGFNALVDLVIGYRYVPRAGGFTCGADVMVLFNNEGVLPWAGVNAGAVF
jgi:hypothetical protein